MSQIVFAEIGWDDYLYWQVQDRKTLKRINQLLKSIERDGALAGLGKPEKMKYLNGVYSRRIDGENRLVYEVSDSQIMIKSCRGHYQD